MREIKRIILSIFACLLLCAAALTASAAQTTKVVTLTNGSVRVQLLSDTLVRVEEKNDRSFEDSTTLVAAGRKDFEGAAATVTEATDCYIAATENYTVKLYKDKTLAEGAVEVTDRSGTVLWTYSMSLALTVPTGGFYSKLPEPGETPLVYALYDYPRVIPAEHGAAYVGSTDAYSDWERNDAADLYLFLSGGSASQLRADFVALTGRTPVSNIKTFGSWYSRYQDWKDSDYLNVVKNYRKYGFPIDVLVVDTKWRAGADGTGYDINTAAFPDMKGFFDEAKSNGVMTIFNDHTHKTGTQALNPTELQYHTENTQKFLKMGLDGWWYDRNWRYSLRSPYAGISPTTFGEVMYNDMIADYAGKRRIFLLSNADWVGNGTITNSPSVIGHRYGIQWTGDITSEALQLREELTNMVHMTAVGASPYLSSDLGGFHRAEQQTPDMYTRWMQFGALSPVFRIHSTFESSADITKLPYSYSAETQNIVRSYMNMRYNLLPLFYTLGHEAYETGLPLTRRLDFYFDAEEAKDDTQYLLGDSLLVAPLWSAYGEGDEVVPASWYGEEGVQATYFNNKNASGKAAYTENAPSIDFDWGNGSPNAAVQSDGFSAVFSGKITPTEDCYIGAVTDDGVKIWVDNQLVASSWEDGWLVSHLNTSVPLSAGKTYSIRVAYFDAAGGAVCRLVYEHFTEEGDTARDVYLPEGSGWINLFDGTRYDRAGTYRVFNGIETTPLYARVGAVIPAVKAESPIKGADFENLSLNIFAGGDGGYTLYEDDGESLSYQSGDVRKTAFTHTTAEDGSGSLTIGAAQGDFTTGYTKRTYTVRIHSAVKVSDALFDGKPVGVKKIEKDISAFPLAESGAAPDGDVFEITFAAPMSSAHTLTWKAVLPKAGDLNGDGKVDLVDALTAIRAALGGKSADAFPKADRNGDGRLTSDDILEILKAVVSQN